MAAPQIIFITIYGLSLGMSLANHGKPKTGTDNFWTALLATAIVFGLLLWGGFFG